MMLWCSHCPAAQAQFPVLNDNAEMTMTAHIVIHHPGTGAWVQGDDWDILLPAERGEIAAHLETITA